MRFSDFDTRGYRMVDVRTGYGEWVDNYEDTVLDLMDLALFERLTTVPWTGRTAAIDLGCGTGRTGEWLRGKGIPAVDGVDLTPQMLDRARGRGAHDRLVEADVTATGLPSGQYDLAVSSLVDEHLDDVGALYREAHRLTRDDAVFALVVFHPQFIMVSGMPTHYTNGDGESVAITTNLHPVSEHVNAGTAAGWRLTEMRESFVDDAWLAAKPKWTRYRGHPVSAAYVWQKASGPRHTNGGTEIDD